MTTFNYQQWRNASAVTPEMLDSCLDRIIELEIVNNQVVCENQRIIQDWRQAEEKLRATQGVTHYCPLCETNSRRADEADVAANLAESALRVLEPRIEDLHNKMYKSQPYYYDEWKTEKQRADEAQTDREYWYKQTISSREWVSVEKQRVEQAEAKIMSQNTIIEALNVVVEQSEAALAKTDKQWQIAEGQRREAQAKLVAAEAKLSVWEDDNEVFESYRT